MDSHLLLQDQRGPVYSYTKMSNETTSEPSKLSSASKSAVTNAFYVSKQKSCRCVSYQVRAAANDLNTISDDTLHIIMQNLGLQEGTRDDSIAKLLGCTPGDPHKVQCKNCCSREVSHGDLYS